MIHLVDIDDGNWRIPLKVSKQQEAYIGNTNSILARAYAYRNSRSQAFLICEDETPVGMGLYYDCEPMDSYDLSHIFIDEQFQRKGYGRAAIELVLEAMRKDGKFDKVVLRYIEGNDTAKNLYASFGFIETDRDGDEIIMELKL